jgi:hypothetical protein
MRSIHTCIYICMSSYIHVSMHTPAARTYAYIHAYTGTNPSRAVPALYAQYAPTDIHHCAHGPVRMRAYTHVHVRVHACMRIHGFGRTHIRDDKHKNTYKPTRVQALTKDRAHVCKQTRAHTCHHADKRVPLVRLFRPRVCTHQCACTSMHLCAYACMLVRLHACMLVCLYACMLVCSYAGVYFACLFVCMCLCGLLRVCMYLRSGRTYECT